MSKECIFPKCDKHGTIIYHDRPAIGLMASKRKAEKQRILEKTIFGVQGFERLSLEREKRSMKLGHADCFYRKHSDLQSCKCQLDCEYCFN